MSRTDEELPDALPDESIVRRVLAGENEAFATIVLRYRRQILALGRRFFRHAEDAEDFTQEVFVRAFRNLASFRGTGRFFSWLMRIAYTLGARTLRRRPRHDSLGELPLAADEPGPQHRLLLAESRTAVRDAVRQLPARYADCVELYFFFDLSYQEVSDVTGIPLNTVRSHLRRAKLLLAERLTEHGLQGSPDDA